MCRVIFLHPDLGIGGAERLVVDAALGLKRKGHSVSIVTTHHDPSRCFEETANGDLSVTVVGNWIPRSVFNKFYALLAYIRIIYASIFILLAGEQPDVVICDLVSIAVPILKFRINNVIFYCHYPDQLLSRPEGILKKLYRIPLDWLEEMSIGMASKVFVNSNFTAKVFKKTFRKINVTPDILYPSLNTQFFDSVESELIPTALKDNVEKSNTIFLSINRYERKKNLRLAIDAFDKLRSMIGQDMWENSRLIMAGGYDPRVVENVEHFKELIDVRNNLDLDDKVIFLKSPNDIEKITLLKCCTCLVYTPSNEHFGIVPVEAMYLEKPVIAVNSGGPMESIVNDKTGYLCNSNATEFAIAMSKFIKNKNLSKKLGEAGKKRVAEMFSFEEFTSKLEKSVLNLVNNKSD